MRFNRSLHARILLGYCVLGLLFIGLVAYALVQFRSLERELVEQQRIVVFYDAIRNARRLEKNFLLYGRKPDLNEAIQQIDIAKASLAAITKRGYWPYINELEWSNSNIEEYRGLLAVLHELPNTKRLPPQLIDKIYAVGSVILSSGERLDNAAKGRVGEAISRHKADLIGTIAAALMLALLAGLLVTRSVVRPLREIERALQRVAKGETERVSGQESASEVASLTQSINDTIQKLEVRQESQARTSRLLALGTMLSGVAHELKNPLSNISSSCQILQEEWQELSAPQAQQLLGQIDHQVVRAERIVASLLESSDNESLNRQSEDLRDMVNEALILNYQQIPDSLHVDIDIAAGIRMDVDRLRFLQVLVNVIKNATDAVATDGSIWLRGRREELPEGRGTTLEIEDDGMGIPHEWRNRIFDPFFTTKPVGKGTGLGLTVAHEIVSQHNGILAVDSRDGAGTRFSIYIPDMDSAGGDHG